MFLKTSDAYVPHLLILHASSLYLWCVLGKTADAIHAVTREKSPLGYRLEFSCGHVLSPDFRHVPVCSSARQLHAGAP